MILWIVCDYSVSAYDWAYPGYPLSFHSDAGNGTGICWSSGTAVAYVPYGTLMTELEVMKAIAVAIRGGAQVKYKPSGKIYDGSGEVKPLICSFSLGGA